MSDYDPLLHRLEADWQESHERFRQMLYDAGRPDLVADLDKRMREINSGVYGARSTWHSISNAQRAALSFAKEAGGRVVLRAIGTSDQYAAAERGKRPAKPIRKPTMCNLCSRKLMAWDGGAFDPEAAAVITERGMFVLKYGPDTQKAPPGPLRSRRRRGFVGKAR